MSTIEVKAIIKAIELVDKIFISEDKTGWTPTLTKSNIYVFEKEKSKKYNFYSSDSFFKVDYSFVETSKSLMYHSGTIINSANPFDYDIFIGQTDFKKGYFTFLIIEWRGIEYEVLFDEFLKGKISEQIEDSINRLGGDVFNMVNFTLPPNFGNDV